MPATQHQELLLVGVCGPPHGVRGEVKVIPETDDLQRLLDLEQFWIGTSADDAGERKVASARLQTGRRGPVVLVHFEGLVDREGAETLRRLRVYARPDDLPPLDEGDVYLHDLPGLEVFAETEGGEVERVGVISDVIEGVAQDLFVVRREGQPDALIPDVEAIVTEVDLDARRVTIRPPEGLLD
jgi:16S rRNA processing protein RimM